MFYTKEYCEHTHVNSAILAFTFSVVMATFPKTTEKQYSRDAFLLIFSSIITSSVLFSILRGDGHKVNI